MTFADMISETESYLLSGSRDQMNKLVGNIGATDTTITLNYPLNGLQQGAYVAIDLEVLYVWAVDETSKSATVERGMLGSTAAAHAANSVVYVNPTNSKWSIAEALNAEIRSLSSTGLFRERSFDLTSDSVRVTYEIPSANTDIIDILEIRFDDVDASESWPKVKDYEISRDLPTNNFASSFAIRLNETFTPGRTLRVRYMAPFAEMMNLTDDPLTISGLAQTMLDIPPLGAAARLMAVREAKRGMTERQTDSRRASEVPPGAASRSASVLLQFRNDRIRTERLLLARRWGK